MCARAAPSFFLKGRLSLVLDRAVCPGCLGLALRRSSSRAQRLQSRAHARAHRHDPFSRPHARAAYSERLLAFANGIHTPAGGSHVDGLKVGPALRLATRRRLPLPLPLPRCRAAAAAAPCRCRPVHAPRHGRLRSHNRLPSCALAHTRCQVALTRVVNAALKRAAAGGAGGATVSKGAASSAGRGSAAAAAAGGAGASALAAPKIKGAKDMGGSLSGE